MEVVSRPAVRIVCLDAALRVLLLRWCDPHDGSHLWEPPGGGIEAGESPVEAARRELAEETGLDPDAIIGDPMIVHRDTVWSGRRFVGPEQFFLARFAVAAPGLGRDGLLPDERHSLRGHAWLTADDLPRLPERLEPPAFAEVVGELCPEHPWRPQPGG